MSATLHSDGGSRGNPGPAGIGFVLKMEDGEVIEYGEYIGETTNNQAEYKALLLGLLRAQEEEIEELECFLDSELVVKQLKGEYRVKDNNLKIPFGQVAEISQDFEHISFTHVPREENTEADRLVNEALDKEAK